VSYGVSVIYKSLLYLIYASDNFSLYDAFLLLFIYLFIYFLIVPSSEKCKFLLTIFLISSHTTQSLLGWLSGEFSVWYMNHMLHGITEGGRNLQDAVYTI
jgi:hypothetical protein